jgi:hypothetical protein
MSQYLMGLVAALPPQPLELYPMSCHMEFMVEEMTVRQVCCKYFGFLAIYRSRTAPYSSISTTICPLAAGVASGLILTQPHATN